MFIKEENIMNFTKNEIWNECERLRELNNVTCAELSKKLFPDVATSYYATRRNLKDGGMPTPFKVLQYFGLETITFSKTLVLGQKIEAIVYIQGKDTKQIVKQLVSALSVITLETKLTTLPQTIRRAIKTGNIEPNFTLTSFEKAFSAIKGLEVTWEYEDLSTNMEAMF